MEAGEHFEAFWNMKISELGPEQKQSLHGEYGENVDCLNNLTAGQSASVGKLLLPYIHGMQKLYDSLCLLGVILFDDRGIKTVTTTSLDDRCLFDLIGMKHVERWD